jgi:hypothetical protein
MVRIEIDSIKTTMGESTGPAALRVPATWFSSDQPTVGITSAIDSEQLTGNFTKSLRNPEIDLEHRTPDAIPGKQIEERRRATRGPASHVLGRDSPPAVGSSAHGKPVSLA